MSELVNNIAHGPYVKRDERLHCKPKCGSSAASTLPSIHNTMDERKPINEYIGFLLASMSIASNILDSNIPQPKPEADRAHPGSYNATTIPAPTRGIKRSRRNPHNDPEDVVDVNGDHQCPFGRCDAVFTRFEDRHRHIKMNKTFQHAEGLVSSSALPFCTFPRIL